MSLPPRAVELWSYLIGLGRVGEAVRMTPRMAHDDLNICSHSNLAQLVTRLVRYGVVRREHEQVYTVLRRIEHEGAPRQKRPRFELGIKHFEHSEWGPTKAERLARLAEIPDDTRGLTARVFNDPIPNDPRRPWQGAHV